MDREARRTAHPCQDVAAPLDGLDLGAVASARWFAAKERRPVAATAVGAVRPDGAEGSAVVLARIEDDRGGEGLYSLPLRDGLPWPSEAPPTDPLWPALARLACGDAVPVPAGVGRPLSDDQSHTSIVLGERVVVKLYRALEAGPFAEADVLQALDGLDGVPRLLGSLACGVGDAAIPLVVVQEYVVAVEAGWETLIERLLELAAGGSATDLLEDAARLGALAARIHVRLAMQLGVEEAAAPLLASRRAAAERLLDEALSLLEGDSGLRLRGAEGRLRQDLALLDGCHGAPLCRIHGDLHVGQVLRRAGGDLTIVDFEGEPGRPPAERAARWTPLRDVASLLLSFDNAAAAAARRARTRGLPAEPISLWSDAARTAALAGWVDGVGGSALRHDDRLLRACFAEKQVSELVYAARYLPEWLYAPLEVLERRFAGAAA